MYFGAAAAPVPILGRWAGVAALAAAGGVVAVGIAADPLFDGLVDALLLPG
ncbi:MAG: hypothetical protein ACRDU8_02665 [Egibacteraceae bacterium]